MKKKLYLILRAILIKNKKTLYLIETSESLKINSCNKQLIVGGVLYKLDQFIANFTFSEKYDSLRDLLQNRIDESQVSLNKKLNIQR